MAITVRAGVGGGRPWRGGQRVDVEIARPNHVREQFGEPGRQIHVGKSPVDFGVVGFVLRSTAASIARACAPLKASSLTNCAVKVRQSRTHSAAVAGAVAPGEAFGAGTCRRQGFERRQLRNQRGERPCAHAVVWTCRKTVSTKTGGTFFRSRACFNASTS